ncbi:hypothetical protein FG465_000062 [Yersinia enterocolitica]|uniref:hypothetical protein n=2 Tax=Yersinia TaxID=629 RepID=UPI0022FF05AA|nr:hypothetical protein [Yersinia kristensenii]EKN3949859.1 hypothetical protein [Yersinia enterocolitica]EKN3987658.1 hypothetical protein [Yersinia enterocolitica]EKN4137952.1 hypothetical protein [Yersinia enterocolitica]EKN4711385.1 hypothetical protein [Yersinia enterocolitica]ELW7378374.1 hypothetical protein [Yersinia enterocolitica]
MMPQNPLSNPKAWENYFKDIVRLHYKPANYFDVPDKHVGDFGIECFTHSGHVFQCYLPEQSSDIAKLVTAQKKKINSDIKKITVDNVAECQKLFGELKVTRWILATPFHESARLAQFCAEKSLDVRNLNVPYIDKEFQIMVHTERDYPQESFSLKKTNYQLSLDLDSVTSEKALAWIDINSTFLEKLDLKLPKIDPSKVVERKNFLIQKYLDYQNLLELLKNDWIDIYQVIFRCIQNREDNLVGQFMLSPDSTLPSHVMKEEINQLKIDITDEIKTLKGTDLEKITWGVISDWLIRCPLDF